MLLSATVLFTIFIQLNAAKIPGIDYPLTAQCSVTWNLPGMDCGLAQKTLFNQINKWDNEDCNGSQRCLYKFVSQTDSALFGTHTTPIKRYVDSFNFKFASTGSGCTVAGYSKSDLWYAILDYGTNYCNLNNLITGSGIDQTNGYEEVTSDKICTQYSSRNCDIY